MKIVELIWIGQTSVAGREISINCK